MIYKYISTRAIDVNKLRIRIKELETDLKVIRKELQLKATSGE